MMKAVMFSRQRYYKKPFFEDHQIVNEDDNSTSDKDDPIDVDTTS